MRYANGKRYPKEKPMNDISRRTMIGAALGAGVAAGAAGAASPIKSGHAVLLGDSIFDNKVYVGDDPAVIDQLREGMGQFWKTTLLAVDGHVTSDIPGQLARLPSDANHLILSIGGNDALRQQTIFLKPTTSVAEGLLELAQVRKTFEASYNAALAAVLSQKAKTVVCTIYDPRFADPTQQRLCVTALAVFNDCILRAAVRNALPVLDLRMLMNQDAYYANAIEPSAKGGEQITGVLRHILLHHNFENKSCVLYGSAPDWSR